MPSTMTWRVADQDVAGSEPMTVRTLLWRQHHPLVVDAADQRSDCGHESSVPPRMFALKSSNCW